MADGVLGVRGANVDVLANTVNKCKDEKGLESAIIRYRLTEALNVLDHNCKNL